MIQLSLSTAAIILAVLCALLVAARNKGAFFSWVLAAALLAAAGLELFDLLALSNPEFMYTWKQGTLIVESMLPPLLALFSLTYAREFSLKGCGITRRRSSPCPCSFSWCRSFTRRWTSSFPRTSRPS
jgi:hypothetical protein